MGSRKKLIKALDKSRIISIHNRLRKNNLHSFPLADSKLISNQTGINKPWRVARNHRIASSGLRIERHLDVCCGWREMWIRPNHGQLRVEYLRRNKKILLSIIVKNQRIALISLIGLQSFHFQTVELEFGCNLHTIKKTFKSNSWLLPWLSKRKMSTASEYIHLQNQVSGWIVIFLSDTDIKSCHFWSIQWKMS